MTTKQKKECMVIVNSASLAAGGIGIGMANCEENDNILITPIQLAMTISLGKVFGRTLSESTAQAAIGSVAASTIGKMISQVLVVKIPKLKNIINTITAVILTESLGWLIAKEFDENQE